MLGYRDEAGRCYRLDQAVVAYQQFMPWRYRVGDWVVEPGLITHHLRIIECIVDENSLGWYRIFDTTLQDGRGDYKLRDADELETKSSLYRRPNPNDISAILQRASKCQYIDYSIFDRTDCESIQAWIHTGEENDRWSSQVWVGVGAAVGGLVLAFGQSKPKRRQRQYTRRDRR